MGKQELFFLAVDAVIFFVFGMLFGHNNREIEDKVAENIESMKINVEEEVEEIKKQFINN